MEKQFIVTGEFEGERLDKFLGKQLDFISRTKINSLIEKGNVFVNKAVKKPSYHLKENEDVWIKIDEPKKSLAPFEFNVNIIYEDDDIIVVDKPQDLVVHPVTAGYHKTLVNALIFMGKELSMINPLRPGIVHRLDKETSGVMVAAKNNFTHLNLVEQFRERKVKKNYFAICWGKITDKKQFLVDLPLRRDEKNRLKMKVSFLKSKKAQTEIEVKEIFNDSTLLSLKLLTGRMHQIRVHLKFLSFPIVGDKKYGIKDDYSELFLHSHKLGFYHPRKGDFVEFISPMPQRFIEFISEHKGK